MILNPKIWVFSEFLAMLGCNTQFKSGYPLQNVRFLLLSSNLARERLQIDTDLLRIITSTADELSGGYQVG